MEDIMKAMVGSFFGMCFFALFLWTMYQASRKEARAEGEGATKYKFGAAFILLVMLSQAYVYF